MADVPLYLPILRTIPPKMRCITALSVGTKLDAEASLYFNVEEKLHQLCGGFLNRSEGIQKNIFF